MPVASSGNISEMKFNRSSCQLAARSAAVAGLLGLLLTGCGREQVRSYRVPKDKEAPVSTAAAADPHAGHNHDQEESASAIPGLGAVTPKVSWAKLPEGWREADPGKMRAASFEITMADGRRADLAIIPLPGITGRDNEIVNLWRDQLQLAPLGADEMSTTAKEVAVGSEKARLFEMVSANPIIEEKYRARIVVAMLTRSEASWFFKLTGEDQLVAAQKANLIDFLKGIGFTEGPTISTAGLPAMGAPATGPVAETPSNWKIPAGWKAQPAGAMLKAKFTAANAESGSADITVSQLGGGAGGTLANVNRWRGQLGLSPIGEAEVSTVAKPWAQGPAGAMLVELAGTAPKPGQKTPQRMLTVIVPSGDQTWFFKMLGEETAVTRERDAFLQFVQSAQPAK